MNDAMTTQTVSRTQRRTASYNEDRVTGRTVQLRTSTEQSLLPPPLPPRSYSSGGVDRRVVPSRPNPLYPGCIGPRLPSGGLLTSTIMQPPDTEQEANGAGGQPVGIRAKVAAFEKMQSSTPAPVKPTKAESNDAPGLEGSLSISRVSSIPRSRPGDPVATEAPFEDPLSELSSLQTGPPSPSTSRQASEHSSSLPPTSPSVLRTRGSNYFANPSQHGRSRSGSPVFSFDGAGAGPSHSPRRSDSGTSLHSFSEASIAKARESAATASTATNKRPGSSKGSTYSSTGSKGISGKVPIPEGASSSSTSPWQQSSISSSWSGRASPALPPRKSPMIASSPRGPEAREPSLRSSRSSISSSSSRHPFDDDDNDGGYGLALHPTIHPTASPTSSRAPSRSSNRSTPSSPVVHARLSAQQQAADVRVQPPTPSPNRRSLPSTVPSLPPRRPSITDADSAAESSPGATPRKQPPALPPRIGHSNSSRALDPSPAVPYAQRSSIGNVASSLRSASPIAGKVPVPPSPMQHLGQRHTSNPSSDSLPLAAEDAQTYATSPSTQKTSMQDKVASAANTSILPPPQRLRSSSVGPPSQPRSRTESQGGGRGSPMSISSNAGGAPLLPPPPRNANQPPARGSSAASPQPSVSSRALTSMGAPTPVRGSQMSLRSGRPPRSVAPRDERVRSTYEALWDREMDRLVERRKHKQGVRGRSIPRPSRMPPRVVVRVWSRSKLPSTLLAALWNAAVAYDRDGEAVLSPTKSDPSVSLFSDGSKFGAEGTTGSASQRNSSGLSKEAFVRGIGAIDAELAWRAATRAERSKQQRLRHSLPAQSRTPGAPAGRTSGPITSTGGADSRMPRSTSSPQNSSVRQASWHEGRSTGTEGPEQSSPTLRPAVVKRKVPLPPPASTLQ